MPHLVINTIRKGEFLFSVLPGTSFRIGLQWIVRVKENHVEGQMERGRCLLGFHSSFTVYILVLTFCSYVLPKFSKGLFWFRMKNNKLPRAKWLHQTLQVGWKLRRVINKSDGAAFRSSSCFHQNYRFLPLKAKHEQRLRIFLVGKFFGFSPEWLCQQVKTVL